VQRSHAKLLIMLYAKLDDEYDQLVCRQLTGLGHVYRRHRVSQSVTVDVDVQWSDILSPELNG